MTKIQLVNYCSPGCEPLKSITRANKEESFILANGLADRNSGIAFNRFGADYKGYYPHRICTEEWLYESFTALGGEPVTKHPLYFVIQGSDFLNEWFGEGIITTLGLHDVDTKDVSFTLGDSMGVVRKLESRKVYLKDEIMDMLAKHNNNMTLFMDHIDKKYKYIEAQIWNDKYIESCKRV